MRKRKSQQESYPAISISVVELRNNLSHYLGMARFGGQSFTVTGRGQIWAVLKPPPKEGRIK